MRYYTTISGDMWDTIAYKTMGSSFYTGELIRLNPQYIDTYRFPAGVTLVLPEPREDIPGGLPPWKVVGM